MGAFPVGLRWAWRAGQEGDSRRDAEAQRKQEPNKGLARGGAEDAEFEDQAVSRQNMCVCDVVCIRALLAAQCAANKSRTSGRTLATHSSRIPRSARTLRLCVSACQSSLLILSADPARGLPVQHARRNGWIIASLSDSSSGVRVLRDEFQISADANSASPRANSLLVGFAYFRLAQYSRKKAV